MNAFLVTGRRITDFLAHGKTPEGVPVECLACHAPMRISQKGAAKLQEAHKSGQYRICGVLCTPCTQVMADRKIKVSSVELSEEGAACLEHSEGARRLLSQLLENIE